MILFNINWSSLVKYFSKFFCPYSVRLPVVSSRVYTVLDRFCCQGYDDLSKMEPGQLFFAFLPCCSSGLRRTGQPAFRALSGPLVTSSMFPALFWTLDAVVSGISYFSLRPDFPVSSASIYAPCGLASEWNQEGISLADGTSLYCLTSSRSGASTRHNQLQSPALSWDSVSSSALTLPSTHPMSVLTMIPLQPKRIENPGLTPQVQCSWMSWSPLEVLRAAVKWMLGTEWGVLALSEENAEQTQDLISALMGACRVHSNAESPPLEGLMCSGRAVRVGRGHISSGPSKQQLVSLETSVA